MLYVFISAYKFLQVNLFNLCNIQEILIYQPNSAKTSIFSSNDTTEMAILQSNNAKLNMNLYVWCSSYNIQIAISSVETL